MPATHRLPSEGAMPLKQDTRHQLNLKGRRLDGEFQALAKAAAGRRGQSLADFVVDAVTAEAQRVLKGEAPEGAAPPARPEDLADRLSAQLAELAAGLRQDQAAALEAVGREARRGRWRRWKAG
jgi:hypothetical protein